MSRPADLLPKPAEDPVDRPGEPTPPPPVEDEDAFVAPQRGLTVDAWASAMLGSAPPDDPAEALRPGVKSPAETDPYVAPEAGPSGAEPGDADER